jgi:hypothetical protein
MTSVDYRRLSVLRTDLSRIVARQHAVFEDQKKQLLRQLLLVYVSSYGSG